VIRPSMCSTDNHPDENLLYGLFDGGGFFDTPLEGVGKGVHQKNVSKIHRDHQAKTACPFLSD